MDTQRIISKNISDNRNIIFRKSDIVFPEILTTRTELMDLFPGVEITVFPSQTTTTSSKRKIDDAEDSDFDPDVPETKKRKITKKVDNKQNVTHRKKLTPLEKSQKKLAETLINALPSSRKRKRSDESSSEPELPDPKRNKTEETKPVTSPTEQKIVRSTPVTVKLRFPDETARPSGVNLRMSNDSETYRSLGMIPTSLDLLVSSAKIASNSGLIASIESTTKNISYLSRKLEILNKELISRMAVLCAPITNSNH